MELSEYMRLAKEFEELIQSQPPHLRLGKTLEFVRDNFKPHEIWDNYSDSLLNTTVKDATKENDRKKDCGAKFASGQWFAFCGEPSMCDDGVNRPLCKSCGGEYLRVESETLSDPDDAMFYTLTRRTYL